MSRPTRKSVSFDKVTRHVEFYRQEPVSFLMSRAEKSDPPTDIPLVSPTIVNSWHCCLCVVMGSVACLYALQFLKRK